ncbi:MAG: thioredoxin family protein [Weeksellaceae bacterium]|nr:thioredoxin family protein [Weeksellaceae bacterium]
MRYFLTLVLIISCFVTVYSQQFFDPDADAEKQLSDALAEAKAENKHVFIEIGGNWCGWCLLFNQLITTDEEINNFINKNFVLIHVNYSKENKNEKILKQLEYPQRFGFPVFVILNEDGKRLHTQNSGYLEEGKGHDRMKVLTFLQQWSPEALNPELYNK